MGWMIKQDTRQVRSVSGYNMKQGYGRKKAKAGSRVAPENESTPVFCRSAHQARCGLRRSPAVLPFRVDFSWCHAIEGAKFISRNQTAPGVLVHSRQIWAIPEAEYAHVWCQTMPYFPCQSSTAASSTSANFKPSRMGNMVRAGGIPMILAVAGVAEALAADVSD